MVDHHEHREAGNGQAGQMGQIRRMPALAPMYDETPTDVEMDDEPACGPASNAAAASTAG
jgi:hypothetical protein